jgi:FMN phosphatase YigB (HAD superfamily)
VDSALALRSRQTNYMEPPIKFIFFDVGNTLLFPNRERIHAPLADRGVTPDAALLRDLERSTKNEFDTRMVKDGSTDHSFWWMFYSQLLARIGVSDDILRDQLVSSIRQSANWDVIPAGTREHLQQISASYKMGIISNADGKIEDLLRRCKIADLFLTITDSGLVGFEKPHPEIFRQALRSPSPRRASTSAICTPSIISARPARACKRFSWMFPALISNGACSASNR